MRELKNSMKKIFAAIFCLLMNLIPGKKWEVKESEERIVKIFKKQNKEKNYDSTIKNMFSFNEKIKNDHVDKIYYLKKAIGNTGVGILWYDWQTADTEKYKNTA